VREVGCPGASIDELDATLEPTAGSPHTMGTMRNCVGSVRLRSWSHVGSLLALVAVAACATGSPASDADGLNPPARTGTTVRDAGAPADDASTGTSSGSGLNAGSDDASGTPGTVDDDATVQSDADNIIGGDDAGDDAAGDDAATPPVEASTPPAYACVTTLASPLPVCDSSHQYCLCTTDTQCNSSGLSSGGCHSGKCAGGGHCSGGQFADSAGCSVVNPTCNIGQCPTGTKCEGGPTSGWNSNSKKNLCGTSLQCCWCTSDSACPVSGKCINDSTQNNCDGAGPCTGSGTNFDGMHCELASPGIPMCSMQ
jgi:hypothetical protein